RALPDGSCATGGFSAARDRAPRTIARYPRVTPCQRRGASRVAGRRADRRAAVRLFSRVRSVRAPRIAPYAAVESGVRQAATLIRGGAPTSSVWATMAAESSGGEQVRDIAALIASGSSCPDAIAAAD